MLVIFSYNEEIDKKDILNKFELLLNYPWGNLYHLQTSHKFYLASSYLYFYWNWSRLIQIFHVHKLI